MSKGVPTATYLSALSPHLPGSYSEPVHQNPTLHWKLRVKFQGHGTCIFKMPNSEKPCKTQTNELFNTSIYTRVSLHCSCLDDLSPGCFFFFFLNEQCFPLPQAAQNSCFLSHKQVISLGISKAEYCLLRSRDSRCFLALFTNSRNTS